MAETIHLLHLEDQEEIVRLVNKLMETAGYSVVYTHVKTRSEFKRAIKKKDMDLIIGDYYLPDFNALEALKILRKVDKETPFILFSGSIGEEKAIESLHNGATDYVLKDRFQKLIPAIQRALKESEIRKERKQVLDQLEFEKELHKKILNIAGVMFVALDTNGNIQLVNEKACHLLGYQEDELIGRNWFDLCIPKRLQKKMREVYEEILTGDFQPMEHYINPIITKQGRERSITWHNSLIRDEQGQITGTLSSGLDITEQEKLQQIIESGPSVVLSWKDMPDWPVEYVSANIQALLGYSSKDILSGRVKLADLVHADDSDTVVQVLKKLKKNLDKQQHLFPPFRLRTKNGAFKWIDFRVRIVQDNPEAPVLFQSILSDITEEIYNKRELKRMETYFRTILDSSHESVMVLDKNYQIMFANKRALELYQNKKKILSNTCYRVTHGNNLPCDEMGENCLLQDVFSTGKTGSIIHRHKTNNGSYRWFNIIFSPIKNETGEVVQVIESSVDITKDHRRRLTENILYNLATAAEKSRSVDEFLTAVHANLATLVDATNLFVGLYNQTDQTLIMPYMQDEKDRFEKVPIAHTYSEWVIKNKKTLLLHGAELQSFAKDHHINRVGGMAKSWLGVPLIRKEKVIGILVMQSYTDCKAYNSDDVRLVEFIANQISGSIERQQIKTRLWQQYRVVEQSPVAIVITDLNGNIEYVNPQFEKVTGYSYNEALGQNPRILKSGETDKTEYEKLWQTITAGNIWHGRFHNKRKDGRLFWEEAIIGPIADEQGNTINFLALKQDITQLKEAEEAFKRISQINEDLLQALTSILIVLDTNENVLRWNSVSAKTFGISKEEVSGKLLLETGIDWDWSIVTEAIASCRSSKQPVSITDLRCRDRQQKEHFLNLKITVFGNNKDSDSGFLILGEDITEWKLLQSQLGQAQKLESIGQLASGIAHEINTPIQFVGDNIRYMQETFFDLKEMLAFFTTEPDNENLQQTFKKYKKQANELDLEYLLDDIPQAMEQTLDGVNRVAKIVKTMKEFTHPHQEEKTAVDLNKALSNSILISKNEWKYVADIETDFEENLPIIPGFLGELNQVFLNLIVNASHAIADVVGDGSNGKGKITIRTKTIAERNTVCIEIEDNGSGVKAENVNRLFDPFFTTKEVGKGTGQGLTLAHSIITQKHRGRLWLETEEGSGTTFFIELPQE